MSMPDDTNFDSENNNPPYQNPTQPTPPVTPPQYARQVPPVPQPQQPPQAPYGASVPTPPGYPQGYPQQPQQPYNPQYPGYGQQPYPQGYPQPYSQQPYAYQNPYGPQYPGQYPAIRKPRSKAFVGLTIAAVVLMFIGGSSLITEAVINAEHSSSLASPSTGNGGTTLPATGNDTAPDIKGTTPSTAAQKVGVVTILDTLDYGSTGEEAAGTGMILSKDGLILTNNHVINGATTIHVEVMSTAKTYTAKVVGDDPTDDVAVLQLENASGLTPVKFDTADDVQVGDNFYSVGNAEGTNNLLTVKGTILSTGQSDTIGSNEGDASENLTDLIGLQGSVVSGDSGGPAFNTKGEVIGMVTAASSGSAVITGYAIDIAKVLPIAKQIESGVPTKVVNIGYPAFLGVQVSKTAISTNNGVLVGGIFSGFAADNAGIVVGDRIISVNGVVVNTGTQLTAALEQYAPGTKVTVVWTDSSGISHTKAIPLSSGPAA